MPYEPQWVLLIRTLNPQADGWVFESQIATVVKTGSICSTAKRSAIDVSAMGP